jgi:hypothetical protein
MWNKNLVTISLQSKILNTGLPGACQDVAAWGCQSAAGRQPSCPPVSWSSVSSTTSASASCLKTPPTSCSPWTWVSSANEEALAGDPPGLEGHPLRHTSEDGTYRTVYIRYWYWYLTFISKMQPPSLLIFFTRRAWRSLLSTEGLHPAGGQRAAHAPHGGGTGRILGAECDPLYAVPGSNSIPPDRKLFLQHSYVPYFKRSTDQRKPVL